ncbi:ankyrin repeat domain-containing protein [Cronobacter sakazakii]|nr:ankyrin repeat domain-containing protein [Cronobacter sakazakii]UMD80976.1 ankyrin repeat domain-containing protein [Klebsiella pneumoniae]
MKKLTDILKTKNTIEIEKFINENNVVEEDFYIDEVANIFHVVLLTKQHKSYEVARMLTKYFDINKQDKAGKTVLFYAVLMGNTEAVKFFISAGGDVSIKDNQGRKAADQITLLELQNASAMSRALLSAEK